MSDQEETLPTQLAIPSVAIYSQTPPQSPTNTKGNLADN